MEANRIDGIDLVSEKEKGRKEKERWGWKGWERCRNGGGVLVLRRLRPCIESRVK